MQSHLASSRCWCQPLALQVCPRCIDDPNQDCNICSNHRLVIPRHKRARLQVFVHDHTLTTEIEACDPSEHIFMYREGIGCSWDRIVAFFSKNKESGKYKDTRGR